MSSILQALKKSELDQTTRHMPMPHKKNNTLGWKIATLLALIVIIGLLSTLIYLVITPRAQLQTNESKIAQIHQPPPLKKLIFETKPLPVIKPNIPPIKAVKAVPTPLPSAPKKTPTTTEIKPELADENDQSIDYENTSSELKKRFELALLLDETDQDTHQTLASEANKTDGSDIHEMGAAFQDKVPLIRYDSHMYSSVLEDRWIRINGEVLKEGSFDSTEKLELLEIQPQRSIFRLGKQSFSLESLKDWKGY